MNCRTYFLIYGLGLILAQAGSQGAWRATEKIPVAASIIRLVVDPAREQLYGVDRSNSDVLIVNLQTRSVRKVYVGKDPTDLDLDVSGRYLYVANKGPGTGAPGSDRIGVIDLESGQAVASWISPVTAHYVTAGRAGRLYSNSGIESWNFGDARSIDAENGGDLGRFAAIKTRMVISSDKKLLYGQYVYDGNLGEMGVFDVSTDNIQLVDRLRYPPYAENYGWGVDNYCLSGDDRVLGYGPVLFNAKKLLEQIGLLREPVGALNFDGSIAFGTNRIWDTTTFAAHGDATEIGQMPFSTTVMAYERGKDRLYAFNPSDRSIYFIERTTRGGIPIRWLAAHALSQEDSIESIDSDGDGITNLQEWIMDGNPKEATAPLKLALTSPSRVTIAGASAARRYVLQMTDTSFGFWQQVEAKAGVGGSVEFTLPVAPDAVGAMFRVQATPF